MDGTMMEPLLITAHTPAGFAASDPWSPSLDGILAYWLLREQLGDEEFALGATGQMPMVTPTDLPLERFEWAGTWWWACSSPIYDIITEYLHYDHRRFDAMEAERFAELGAGRRVATGAGPYKQYRQAQRIILASEVRWHCVGEPCEIRRLLCRCTSIGAGGTRGLGRVSGWDVTAEGADPWLARLLRPLPVDAARDLGISGPEMDWGIRPPARALENHCICVMPPEKRQ